MSLRPVAQAAPAAVGGQQRTQEPAPTTGRLAAVLAAGLRMHEDTGPPAVKREAGGDGGQAAKKPKYASLAQRVVAAMIETFGYEIRDKTNFTLLAGTHFDVEESVRQALWTYSGQFPKNNPAFKAGLATYLPNLTDFEKEMVDKDLIEFDKWDGPGAMGVFRMKGYKLVTLGKSDRPFALKALVWLFSHLEEKELAGTILEFVDEKLLASVQTTSIDNMDWRKLLETYAGVYEEVKVEVQKVRGDIDISGMFGREITVEYVIGNNQVDRYFFAKKLKAPTGRVFTEAEAEIKRQAMAADAALKARLAQIKADDLSYPHEWLLYNEEERILDATWTPFLRQRLDKGRKLRNLIELPRLPVRQMKFQQLPPPAPPAEVPAEAPAPAEE